MKKIFFLLILFFFTNSYAALRGFVYIPTNNPDAVMNTIFNRGISTWPSDEQETNDPPVDFWNFLAQPRTHHSHIIAWANEVDSHRMMGPLNGILFQVDITDHFWLLEATAENFNQIITDVNDPSRGVRTAVRSMMASRFFLGAMITGINHENIPASTVLFAQIYENDQRIGDLHRNPNYIESPIFFPTQGYSFNPTNSVLETSQVETVEIVNDEEEHRAYGLSSLFCGFDFFKKKLFKSMRNDSSCASPKKETLEQYNNKMQRQIAKKYLPAIYPIMLN